jgi:hypothetical protein
MGKLTGICINSQDVRLYFLHSLQYQLILHLRTRTITYLYRNTKGRNSRLARVMPSNVLFRAGKDAKKMSCLRSVVRNDLFHIMIGTRGGVDRGTGEVKTGCRGPRNDPLVEIRRTGPVLMDCTRAERV